MARTQQTQIILHYPTLNTVLMVEDVLRRANNLMNREQLKKKLPTKVMHQTLNVILKYLEDSGKILDGRKGICWIYNPSLKLQRAIERGIEIKPSRSLSSFCSQISSHKSCGSKGQ
jgi:hypothetical protein